MMNKKTIDSEQIEEAKGIAIEKLIQLNDENGFYSYNSDEQRKLEALIEGAVEMGAGIANDGSDEQASRFSVDALVIRKARDIAEEIVKEGINDEEHLAYYTNEIKGYAKAKCKEQRANCANNMPSRWETETIGHEDLEDIDKWIFNAPEPSFNV